MTLKMLKINSALDYLIFSSKVIHNFTLCSLKIRLCAKMTVISA